MILYSLVHRTFWGFGQLDSREPRTDDMLLLLDKMKYIRCNYPNYARSNQQCVRRIALLEDAQ